MVLVSSNSTNWQFSLVLTQLMACPININFCLHPKHRLTGACTCTFTWLCFWNPLGFFRYCLLMIDLLIDDWFNQPNPSLFPNETLSWNRKPPIHHYKYSVQVLRRPCQTLPRKNSSLRQSMKPHQPRSLQPSMDQTSPRKKRQLQQPPHPHLCLHNHCQLS